MANLTFTPPADGAAVTMQNGRLCVPDRPVIPFIIGDGTGPEIWAAASRVIDAAVAKAYQGRRSIAWYEVFAGQKSFDNLGTWLPNETVEAFRTYLIGIKGPLTTPVGGGIRSLNVTLRQDLDLFVCLRPVRYFNGTGVPQDYLHARYWCMKAAENGVDEARLLMARFYLEALGVERDEAEGVAGVAEAAVQKGKTARQAQAMLGSLFQRGVGVERDLKMAYVWYSVAAANGDGGAPISRDLVAKGLSADELDEAQALAGQYFERFNTKS